MQIIAELHIKLSTRELPVELPLLIGRPKWAIARVFLRPLLVRRVILQFNKFDILAFVLHVEYREDLIVFLGDDPTILVKLATISSVAYESVLAFNCAHDALPTLIILAPICIPAAVLEVLHLVMLHVFGGHPSQMYT